MHHPGCWVRNSGCATASPHRSVPAAQAFSGGAPPGDPAPHPGEGTRVASQAQPEIGRQPPAAEPEPPLPSPATRALTGDGWPVIGGTPVPAELRRAPDPGPIRPPTPPRRYVPPEGEHGPKPMPKVYGRSPLLAYWYVPAAVVLAIVVAFGVIWAADQLFGSSDSAQAPAPAAASPQVSPAATASPATTSPAGAQATATGAASPTPTRGSGTSTKFQFGDVAVVTGAGDCLNVRTAPGRANDAIVCLNDGEEVTVTGGPESANDLQWWKVRTKLGEGWAAEDYLVKK